MIATRADKGIFRPPSEFRPKPGPPLASASGESFHDQRQRRASRGRPLPSSTCWRSTPRTCRSRIRTRRASLAPQQQQPAINIQINVSANNLAENEFEVTLSIEGKAENAGKVMFSFDLAYAGVFRIVNVPKENLHPLVMIECPRLLFPFAREIIATSVRDGGFPPLMLDPVDFVGLYRQSMPGGRLHRPGRFGRRSSWPDAKRAAASNVASSSRFRREVGCRVREKTHVKQQAFPRALLSGGSRKKSFQIGMSPSVAMRSPLRLLCSRPSIAHRGR